MSETDEGRIVVIRRVTRLDLDACFEIEARSFLPSEAASRENIARRIEMFPEGFLVAESDGRVVGHINSGSTSKDDITDEAFKAMVGHDSAGENVVVFSLAVLPEFRKQGIATRLMLRFVEDARQLGKRRILLICKADLIPYYRGYGFAHLGKSASTHGGFQWHEMCLPLDTRVEDPMGLRRDRHPELPAGGGQANLTD
jgi:ribosomal protein S18 acetylase RimI-like enzyme